MGYRDGVAWRLFTTHAAKLFAPDMHVLEVGPGKIRKSLPKKFLDEAGCEYSFCDRKNYSDTEPGYVRMPDSYAIDKPNDSFDAAICYEMLHNCDRPWRLLPEVVRVLKPCGLLVVVDSLAYGEFNRHPIDFGRIFPDGMATLFQDAGCERPEVRVGSASSVDVRQRGIFDAGQEMHSIAWGRKR